MMKKALINYNPEINKVKIKAAFLVVFFSFLFFIPSSSKAQLIEPHSQAVESTGDVILYALPASVLATTFIVGDTKGAWQFTKSFLTNQALTTALKFGLNKERPYHGGGQAFPSGHTSATFQAASFVHRRYGFKYSIPGYVLASFTAYSRLNATKHDGYDVIAGILVGVGSTYLFTTPRQREQMDLSFKSGNGEYLLSFTYKF